MSKSGFTVLFRHIYETIELEPSSSKLNYHEEMIKNLQMELARRQELQVQLISIYQRKQQTEIELEGKKKKIDEFRIQLQNLLKVKYATNVFSLLFFLLEF